MEQLSVVILAAGQGKRMQSARPKVLHSVGGKAILRHVVDAASALTASSNIYVIFGHEGEQVQSALSDTAVQWVYQAEQLGTGHAVSQALPHIPEHHNVLVLCGDSPLVQVETLQKLIHLNRETHGISLLTTIVEQPKGYGRIVRDAQQQVCKIVEERDADAETRQIREINTGIILASASFLKENLNRLSNQNDQKEFLLTDIIGLAVQQNLPVHAELAADSGEFMGINDRTQLAQVERLYQSRCARQLMLEGITLYDPNRIDIRGTLAIGKDSEIDINVIFLGQNNIGKNVKIGANCILKDVIIHDNAVIEANSHLDSCEIHSHAIIGPFARIRPGSEVMQNAQVGNFIELKKTIVGESSKAHHLGYLGDAVIGSGVNIGAGTITANYDGANKYQTVIEDGAFIGSGTELIAPVTVKTGAYIGAGSTINHDAPPEQLTLARAKQTTIENWQKPVKSQKS